MTNHDFNHLLQKLSDIREEYQNNAIVISSHGLGLSENKELYAKYLYGVEAVNDCIMALFRAKEDLQVLTDDVFEEIKD